MKKIPIPVLITLLLLPIIIWYAAQIRTNTHDLNQWLPMGVPSQKTYSRFVENFGNDETIMLSWADCTIDDARLADISNWLRQHDTQSFLHQVNDTASAIHEIEDLAGDRLSSLQIKRGLRGMMLGDNLNSSGVVLTLSNEALQDRNSAMTWLNENLETFSQSHDSLIIHKAGSPVVTTEIQAATNQSLFVAWPGAILACLVVCYCLRSIRWGITCLVVSGIPALATVALVSALGFQLNGLMVVTPILILVLNLSSCIHFCMYAQKYLLNMSIEPAIQAAFSSCRPPTCLAFLTTIVGILSLASSHLSAVQQFAWFSVTGLVLGLLTVLWVLPYALLLTANVRSLARPNTNILGKSLSHLATFSVTFANLFLMATIAAGLLAAIGLFKIKSDLSPEKLFAAEHRLNLDFKWIDKNFVPLNKVDMVVELPAVEEMSWDRQVQLLHQIQKKLTVIPEIRSTFSAAQFAPDLEGQFGARTTTTRQFINTKFADRWEQFRDNQLLAKKDGKNLWRIVIGVDSAVGSRIEGFNTEIEKAAENVLHAAGIEGNCEATGIWVLSCIGRELLYRDLASSFVGAFLAITPMMMFSLGSVWAGLIAMIPNVLPAVLLFGGLGWWGANVDIGTLLTASVGMGIAVDDTLHFLHHFRRESRATDNVRVALSQTILQAAKPMFYTAVTVMAGLSFFAFTEFLPSRQFAISVVVLLLIASAADLIQMPLIIITPLGRAFIKK